ncbi:Aste57867_2846 [Aphanomyces stellatus]|uniref:Aste57867_2846 protein n=1 Tax=Aphanomyces stellatus TaxID=120398 RepID=A0A485KE43_9STRA|nr:hypothetical protein As57867_002838 [Aphanomyces stellatus]VFT80033.1 Aste57867_2846 [Aphanomyces stellatus]
MSNSVLEALAVTLTKAIVVPANTQSALYTLTVTNKTSHTDFSTTKTDADFEHLRDRVLRALDRGHSCDALCPWFYVDIEHILPKKAIFRKATHAKVVDAHMRAYQKLMEMLLMFVKNPHNRSCHRAMDLVPDALFDFLFESNCSDDSGEVNPGMFTPVKPRLSSTSSTRSQHMLDSLNCSLCCGSSDSCGWTTLACGHTFHDDCVLAALSDSLRCPTCQGTTSFVESLYD